MFAAVATAIQIGIILGGYDLVLIMVCLNIKYVSHLDILGIIFDAPGVVAGLIG